MSSTPPVAAALAGVPVALQQHGVWSGRRQLFVKFAGPAETAMMYTSDALAREVQRTLQRSRVHSICIAGRDALANEDFLAGALEQIKTDVPVMADTDGQRPGAIERLHSFLQLVQVTVETGVDGPLLERVVETIEHAERLRLVTAVAITGQDGASDSDYLRIVESVAGANAKAMIVLHPGPAEEKKPLERRWSSLMEQASALHQDVRVLLRLQGTVTPR